MNFPKNQRIGRVGEIKVELVFTEWSWTVGKDLIDTGYDFFVEPEVSLFRGHRFLVQVKATEQNKRGKAVARVKKSRLRDYAQSPYPVIVIWSSSSGVLHWMHVQPWIVQNLGRLSGDGEAGVPMPDNQTLEDKDGFVAYLVEILKSPDQSSDALPKLADKRSQVLSAIDPRLNVRVGLEYGRESYEIYATSSPVNLGFDVKLKAGHDGAHKLMDAIRYGLPASVEVDSFKLKGSEMFAAIGANGNNKGTMSIGTRNFKNGEVSLYAGAEYSILAESYSFPAKLYKGSDGFAITNEELGSLLGFKLTGDVDKRKGINLNVTFETKHDSVVGVPIQTLNGLARLGEWAFGVRESGAMCIELIFDELCVPIKSEGENIERLDPLFYFAFVLGRLHQVAKALNSNFTLKDQFEISDDDVSDIHFAFRVLKGERVSANVGPVVFEAELPEQLGSGGDFRVETALVLSIAGQELGVLPITMDLNNYIVEKLPGEVRFQIVAGANSSSLVYHNSLGPLDAKVARVSLPGNKRLRA